MINMILDDASDRMQKAIEAYQRDLATVTIDSFKLLLSTPGINLTSL